MDKAVIVGTYETVGYHLCEALLQEGIEVYGVHIRTNLSEANVDEKRLFIGRNSNFVEKDETSLAHIQNDMFIFIDYYSFYMAGKEDALTQKVQPYLENERDLSLAAILPIQKLDSRNDIDEKNREKKGSRYRFYLPADERECMSRSEWIEDVIEGILQIIDGKRLKL